MATGNCADFMEWNARAQLTTWYPTLKPDQSTPGQQGGKCNNYARKQWGGLIALYDVPRLEIDLQQALADAAAGGTFSFANASANAARLSYDFQTNFSNIGPIEGSGDPAAISVALRAKYSSFFTTC